MSAKAYNLSKYFAMHEEEVEFKTMLTSRNEVAIFVSREDFERYVGTSSKCCICGEGPRPYTKGELKQFHSKKYHEKCFKKLM